MLPEIHCRSTDINITLSYTAYSEENLQ